MSDATHTLKQLEEQQKKRLIKQQAKKDELRCEEKKKEHQDNNIEKTPLNVCKCSVDANYDNFDGCEDELDLKVSGLIHDILMRIMLFLDALFIN